MVPSSWAWTVMWSGKIYGVLWLAVCRFSQGSLGGYDLIPLEDPTGDPRGSPREDPLGTILGSPRIDKSMLEGRAEGTREHAFVRLGRPTWRPPGIPLGDGGSPGGSPRWSNRIPQSYSSTVCPEQTTQLQRMKSRMFPSRFVMAQRLGQ